MSGQLKLWKNLILISGVRWVGKSRGHLIGRIILEAATDIWREESWRWTWVIEDDE